MIPGTQWLPKADATAVYARLVDNLATCVDRPQLFMTFGKAMAHLHANSVTIKLKFSSKITELGAWRSCGDKSHFIREAFADAHHACDQRKNTEQDNPAKHEANARSALRTIMVHGWSTRLSRPDDGYLIWNDDGTDAETEGDALLALSAVQGLGSSAKRPSYVRALTRCMASPRTRRVRCAALRVVSEAREELAFMTNSNSASLDVDATLLDELSDALLTAVVPHHDQTLQDSTSDDASFPAMPNYHYLRLIFALQKNDEWCKLLAHGGHLGCISSSLYDVVLVSPWFLDKVYLAGILLRVDTSSNDISPNPAQEKWRMLIQGAWSRFYLFSQESNLEHERIIEALQALVTMTRQNLPDTNNSVASAELAKLKEFVYKALRNLKRNQRYLRPQADVGLDGAVLTVQCLYDVLSSYTASENGHTPRGDIELLES
ncbi:hypothetical protein AZE42_13238 [Rhizopogon vesiculosus]|uniref:Uncharacterized protein n=1 Tax=Rhizopogon vesiculosus TaxID=180088 RepID=A0A1J8QCU1_9AGAM|nr:hypothetical protein AZE42_13238 [Rhizopogon vesiculosus]